MGRRALVLLVALLLTGIAGFAVFQFVNGIRTDEPRETSVSRTEVEEVRLSDGTRCAVLIGPGVRSGIDCDWDA